MKRAYPFLLLLVVVAGLSFIVTTPDRGEFAGEVLLPLTGKADIAIAPHGENPLEPFAQTHTVYTNATPAELRGRITMQAEALLEGQGRYDAAVLPFALEVEEAHVLDQGVVNTTLTIDGPEGKRTKPIDADDTISIGDTEFTVVGMRPWSGIFPRDHGRPMAAIAVGVGDSPWIEGIVAQAGSWEMFEPAGAVRLEWVDSESAARAHANDTARNAAPRWGVREGDRMHWFEGTTPGMGVTLNDGTQVTLAEVTERGEDRAPAITVTIVSGESKREVTIPANNESAMGMVRFEYPSARAFVLRLYGWTQDTVYAVAMRDGEKADETVLERGQVWGVAGGDERIRLDGALPAAVEVPENAATAYEIVLASEDRELRLRHGERFRMGNSFMEFKRIPEPGLTELLLVAHHADSSQVTTFRLAPNQDRKILSWRLKQIPSTVQELDAFILEAIYSPGIPYRTWGGLGISVLATFFLAIRFLPIGRRN